VAKALVIENSLMMRLYLRRCLEADGFEVEDWVPLSAMEVVEKVQSALPDILFTGMQMQGCNGASVARMARKANPGLPVLVLACQPDAEVESGLLKAGATRVLWKPIPSEMLVREARRALEAVAGPV
jgi:CheY-like chemotaxis protein